MVWWVRSDPCGIFTALLSLFLLLFAEYVVVFMVLMPWLGFEIHSIAFSILIGLAIISHTKAQFTDPGTVPKNYMAELPPLSSPSEIIPPEKKVRVCKKCKTFKPSGVHHCSTCSRCILRMDHHCPWVNNCVAVFNQKYFILFLLYTASASVYCCILLVARFLTCTAKVRQCMISPAGVACSIIVFIVAIIFGLFTIVMMFDQISAIFDNTTTIDAMQHRRGRQRTKMESLVSVFGESPSWKWLFPFRTPGKLLYDFEQELQTELAHIQEMHSGNGNTSPSISVQSDSEIHSPKDL